MKPKGLMRLQVVAEALLPTKEGVELWNKFDTIAGELQVMAIHTPELRKATDDLYKAYKTIDEYIVK